LSREYINPPGLFKHTHYTRVLTVDKPSNLIYIAGQTPADDKYQPVHPGDVRAQYIAVLEGLTLQLNAAGATCGIMSSSGACTRLMSRAS
jgi:enamine deaminase RidA (YjgF/YER057c/UK114 family)